MSTKSASISPDLDLTNLGKFKNRTSLRSELEYEHYPDTANPAVPVFTYPAAQKAYESQQDPKPLRRRRTSVIPTNEDDSSSPVPAKRARIEGHPILPPKAPSREPTRVPLTKEALHQLDRINFPSASKAISLEKSDQMADSTTTEEQKCSIGPYNPDYKSALEDRGIVFADDQDDLVPADLADLKEAILAPRKGPGPDEAAAKILRKQISRLPNEAAVVQSILPKVVPLEEIMNETLLSTSPEQFWSRKCLIAPELKPTVATPKPDRTFGWSASVFRQYKRAKTYLKLQMLPVAKNRELAWPLFTVEVKGDQGDMKIAKLQNLHNGAILLSNLLSLRQLSKQESAFYDKVHVMSLELTAESIQLSCYWAALEVGTKNTMFYGMRLRTWSVYETDAYIEAWRCTRNALETVRNRALPWIRSDLAVVEEMLTPKMPPAMPTPDQSKQIKRSRSVASGQDSVNSDALSTNSNKKPCTE